MPEPNTGCLLWMGGTNEHGYGIIGLGTREQGTDRTHRVSWRLHRGEIPPGANVLHRCDTPACVNPAHLFLGTLSDNSRDMVTKGRDFRPDNRGERAKWRKLCSDAVRDIRTRRMSSTSFARLYGVSKSAVCEIWRGRTWASVR